MSKTMTKTKDYFEISYPCPKELLEPLRNVRSTYRFNVFANFHYTRLGLQVAIRQVRQYYCACVRGWACRAQLANGDKLVRYDNSWSEVTARLSLADAISDYDALVTELLNLSDEQVKLYNSLGKLSHVL